MKQLTIQKKSFVIEQLRKTPIVQVVCEKIKVSRASYYRWRVEDPDFRKATDDALREGSLLVNDLAEAQLISAIKDKNLRAITYWLNHNHSTYANRVELTTINKNKEIVLTDEQKELLNKALKMASLGLGKEADHE